MIAAFIDHDRFIAECPRCHWAIQGTPEELARSFVCGVLPDGRNLGQGCGFSDRVQIPAEAETIRRVLNARPRSEDRNWKPGETVADLRIENAVHGLASGLEEA